MSSICVHSYTIPSQDETVDTVKSQIKMSRVRPTRPAVYHIYSQIMSLTYLNVKIFQCKIIYGESIAHKVTSGYKHSIGSTTILMVGASPTGKCYKSYSRCKQSCFVWGKWLNTTKCQVDKRSKSLMI